MKENKPKISFFATYFNQKSFLQNYFDNLLSLKRFDECELVIVKPPSYDKEEKSIFSNYSSIKNIKIHELDSDPGLYSCWNKAINICSSDILSNANIDDRRIYNCIDIIIENFKDNVDLVYGDYKIASTKEELERPFACSRRSILPEFSIENMIKYCLPGNAPFWKKSLMDERGFRSDLGSCADLEFWLRLVRKGANFKKINEILSVYYFNPSGQSTSNIGQQKRAAIESEIKRQYAKVFNYSGDVNGSLDEIWIQN